MPLYFPFSPFPVFGTSSPEQSLPGGSAEGLGWLDRSTVPGSIRLLYLIYVLR